MNRLNNIRRLSKVVKSAKHSDLAMLRPYSEVRLMMRSDIVRANSVIEPRVSKIERTR